MNAKWLLDPLTQVAILGGALGFGLMGSLLLWLATRMKLRALGKALENLRICTEATINELSSRIDEIRAAPIPDPMPAVMTAVQGVNMTNRTKALRMHRRGEPIASIAAVLGVQQEEIELLLKLDRLLELPAA